MVAAAGDDSAQTRFLEFFAANIRNKNTRRAYAQATREFLAWCERARVASIPDVQPLHVAVYIERLRRRRGPRRPSNALLARPHAALPALRAPFTPTWLI